MTAASREEFAALVREPEVDLARACLLLGCEVSPELSVDASLTVLDELATRARGGPLGAVLGAFRGEPEDYDDLRSSLLHEVLRRQRGLPIMLSLVWCEVATRLGSDAVCLGLPGHVLACVDGVVVDPFHGGVVREVAAGPPLVGGDFLLRVLANVRALSARRQRSIENVRTQLWATELSLLLPRHSLDLRRQRGELLVRLGALREGALELEEFASLAPDEDVASKALQTARHARARLN